MRIEPTSLTWLTIKAELEDRKEKLYRAIADEGISERQADVYRGQIKEIIFVLSMDPEHIPGLEDTTY